jgi:hypothetical protein
VALGWTGDVYAPVALAVGAIVCIAAANAGNTSQDLKTGYLVGATPYYQQLGLAIGVVTSAFIIGITVLYMHQVFGIGSKDVAAPQATLMATLIQGLLSQNLPWGLVLVGVFIAVTLELCGIRSLSFAVGAYLPTTTAPIFVGGLVRWFVERKTGMTQDSDISTGTLFAQASSPADRWPVSSSRCWSASNNREYPILSSLQSIGNALPFLHAGGASGQLFGAGLFGARGDSGARRPAHRGLGTMRIG